MERGRALPPRDGRQHYGLPLEHIAEELDPRRGYNAVFLKYLEGARGGGRQYLVGDARASGNEIVACSDTWLRRCGYANGDDFLGRTFFPASVDTL